MASVNFPTMLGETLPLGLYLACAVRMSHNMAIAATTSAMTTSQNRHPHRRHRRAQVLHMRCICAIGIMLAFLLWIVVLQTVELVWLSDAVAREHVTIASARYLSPRAQGKSLSAHCAMWKYLMAAGMASLTYWFERKRSGGPANLNRLNTDASELGRTFHLTTHRAHSKPLVDALQLYKRHTTVALCRRNYTCAANPNIPDMLPAVRRKRQQRLIRRCTSMESIPDFVFAAIAEHKKMPLQLAAIPAYPRPVPG